ncbi:MAG: hypothetical protein QOE98_983, partial [Gaiellaceae bacterium]|nr:hypothetical protein [Gaiellaceae bacterium]
LAIVQAIAGAHGGTASAANAEDGGARITVVIPDSAPSHDGDGIAN